MKLGVMLDSFRCGWEESLKKAAELGFGGVQLTVAAGELTAESVRDYPVREILESLDAHGLELTALCGLSGYEYNDPAENDECVEKTCLALDLADRFGCRIVTSHIGTVPPDECRAKDAMRDALNRISLYGGRIGARFAIETGPEPGHILGELLDSLDGGGIGVNFDPANLVMCSDDRPEEALRWLGKYVVHTHAKDGIMIPKRMEDPAFGDAMRAEMRQMLERGRIWYEMPLGEGDVDFDVYLPALAETGFDGWLTIEREVGASPERDIALAADFLRTVCARHGIALA